MSFFVKNICDEFVDDILIRSMKKTSDEFEFEHYSKESGKDESSEVSVLVQNAWSVPAVSKNLKERFEKLFDVIEENKYDIIVFLEVWSQTYREKLIEASNNRGIYNHYTFASGTGMPVWPYINGSGMLVFSKYAIIEAQYHRYTVNGLPHRMQHTDYYAGKGVGLCRIKKSENAVIDLYVSHVHASYESDHSDYLGTRALQIYELCQFINNSHNTNNLCLLLGDLNTQEGELPYKLLHTEINGLRDAWLDCNASNNKSVNYIDSVTFQHPDNTYYNSNGKEGPQRLDYIFYILPTTSITANSMNSPRYNIVDGKKYEWKVMKSEIVKIYTKKNHSLSDHFGVMATFELKERTKRSSSYGSNIDEINSIVDDKSSISSMDKSSNCSGSSYNGVLLEMRTLMRNAIKEDDKLRYHNNRYGILIYLIVLIALARFGNLMPNWMLVVLFLTPIYCMYQIVYTKLVVGDSIRQYKEILNQINLKCKNDNYDDEEYAKGEMLI